MKSTPLNDIAMHVDRPEVQRLKRMAATIPGRIAAFVPGTSVYRVRCTQGTLPVPGMLNIEQLAAQLKVDYKARADGSRNMPPADAEIVSGTQREIISHFRQLQQSARQRATALAKKLASERPKLSLAAVAARMQDIPSRCQRDIERHLAEFESRLAFRTDRDSGTVLPAKPADNGKGADRTATATDSDWMQSALVIALVAAVALLVLDYFQPGIVYRDAVSAAWAIALATGFVIIPLAAGASLAAAAHSNALLQSLFSWLVAVLAIVVVAGTAFIAAWIVATGGEVPGLSVQDGKDAVLSAATMFSSNVLVWTTVGIVVLAGTLAWALGYRSAKLRRSTTPSRPASVPANRQEFHARRLRKRINAIVDTGEKEVLGAFTELKSRSQQWSRLLDEVQGAADVLAAYDTELEDACSILLERYRAINIGVRDDGVPMCFAEQVCFRIGQNEHAYLDGDEERFRRLLQDGLDEMETFVAGLRQQLRELNRQAIGNIGPDGLRGGLAVAPVRYSDSYTAASNGAARASDRARASHSQRQHGII